MAVQSKIIKIYVCTCDKCGAVREIEKTDELYNAAQAVRSIGWKYGKDGSVRCAACRNHDWNDHYSYIAQYKQKIKTTS